MLSARALGGGSAVNALMWFRGHPLDYDGWASDGAEGWGWEAVAPVFRSREHYDLGPDEHHGAGAPMVISDVRDVDPLALAFIAAGSSRGLAVTGNALISTDPSRAEYVITGPETLSYADAAAVLSDVLARPIRHRSVSVDQLTHRMVAAGYAPEFASALAALDVQVARRSEDRVTSTVQDVIGRPARSFREVISAAVHV